jgi:hypothetical protein
MPQPVGSTIDLLLDLGPETLIGALILATLIATVTAWVYSWLRRGKPDATTILVALIIVANLACLTAGAGFVRSRSNFLQLRSISDRTGSFAGVQEDEQRDAPRRRGRPGPRWRQASQVGRAPAKRVPAGEAAPVSLHESAR